jgi:hypothetical protein
MLLDAQVCLRYGLAVLPGRSCEGFISDAQLVTARLPELSRTSTAIKEALMAREFLNSANRVQPHWMRDAIVLVSACFITAGTLARAEAKRQVDPAPAAQAASGARVPNAKDKATKSRRQGVNTDLFLPTAIYDSGGKLTSAMALADFNGDHKMDIVVVNSGLELNGHSTVGVMLGNGDGTFKPVVAYDTGTPSSSTVAVGDLNGDGKLDIVVGDSANTISALLGNGDGTFQPAVVYSTGTPYLTPTIPVFVADLNRDGYDDVIAVTDYSLSVLLGSADGTLQPAINSYSGDSGPLTSLALVDLNHDVNLDAITLGSEADLWFGSGNGYFGEANLIAFAGGNSQAPIAVVDVNGDGIPDLIFGDGSFEGGGAVSVLIGKGNGSFYPAVNYQLPPGNAGVTSMVVTDLNGDGKPDIATASNQLNVFLNNGDGTFRLVLTYPSLAIAVKAVDLNLDGKPDLLLLESFGSNNQSDVEALLGNGDGTFNGGGLLFFTGGGSPTDFEVLDLNGDGRPDVLVANASGAAQDGSVGVLLNNKNFVFALTQTTLSSSPNPTIFGQSVTFTANVTSASGVPDGTVGFVWTANPQNGPFGSATLSNGTASFATPSLPAGSNPIVAQYQGSENFASSASSTVNQVVSMATSATSVFSSRNPANVGQTVEYTASVQSQFGGYVGGSITIYDGTKAIYTFYIGGKKTFVKEKYTSPGIHSITASYSGDANNRASTSAPLLEQVLGATSTVVTTSGSPSHVGQAVTFTATVTSIYGAVPDGELVTFYDAGKMIGTGALTAGSATYTTAMLKAKKHTIKAVYLGDSIFKTSSGTVVQVVEQ